MPDFGIQFLEWVNPRSFDAIGLLWEQCSTLSAWYDLAQRYIHLENNAVRYSVFADADEVALVHEILEVLKSRSSQFMCSFLGLTVKICRSVFGPGWNPVRVEFASGRPVQLASYRRFFQCDMRFGEDRYALIIRPEDYTRQLPHANAEMLAYMRRQLDQQSLNWSAEIDDQVTQIIYSEIAGKAPTLVDVADRIAMSPRTLQRRLLQRGTDFGSLLKAVRKDIVKDRLARSRPVPLAQLAFDLGFSEASAASRFIRSELGISFGKELRVARSR